MLTPPYHFSIVACPPVLAQAQAQAQGADDAASKPPAPAEILYRGSIPASRNLPFLRRLGIRTLVYLKKKELKADEAVIRWGKRHGVDLKWVKAEKMGEESLGIGRGEVGDILRMLLNPTLYPIYVADTDGISHTTLIVACLRKLQGWAPDAILSEITRFEPDHEDLPLTPFITAYLTSGPSTETLSLPTGPYPSWLWPIVPSAGPVPLTNATSLSRSNTVSKEGRNKEARDRDREKEKEKNAPETASAAARDKEKERERSSSQGITSPILPFPHPVAARRHPTMRLSFPTPVVTPSAPAPALSRANSRRDRPDRDREREREQERERERSESSVLAANTTPPASLPAAAGSVLPQDNPSLMAAATSLLAASFGGIVGVIGGAVDGARADDTPIITPMLTPNESEKDRDRDRGLGTNKITRMVSFHDERYEQASNTTGGSISGGSTNLSRVTSPEKEVVRRGTKASSETGGISRAVSSSSSGGDTSGSAGAGESVQYEDPEEYGQVQPEPAADSGSSSESGSTGAEESSFVDDDEEYDEDEDEDEEEDDSVELPSLHISALDLAGYG